jgi:release factor glutamine methyltransferase
MGQIMTGLPSAPCDAALRNATLKLAGVSETPRLDAELLMVFALGCSRSALLLGLSDLCEPDGFAALIERRMAHEPVAYITGTQAFWDIDLHVTPDVLIPRADSETLIEAAVAAFPGRERPRRILDLGTGSGALLLAALSAFPSAQGTGIDASAAALGVAKGNADRLGFGERATFHCLNWRDANWATALGSPFDLILCNPPYVEENAALAPMVKAYEPHSALFAGADGMDDYARLLPAIPSLLAQGGIAVFEIGASQAQAVSDLAQASGLMASLHIDLAGNPRALTFTTVHPV